MSTLKTFQTRLNAQIKREWSSFNVNGTRSGGPSFSVPTSYSVARNGEVFHGDNITDWRKRVREKSSATTNLTAKGVKIRGLWQGEVFGDLHWPTKINAPYRQIERLYGDIGIPGTVNNLPTETSMGSLQTTVVHNRVIMGFIKKALAAQQTLNGGVVLGELRETIHGFKRPASGIRNFFNSYCNNVRKVINTPRGVKIRNYTKKRDRVREFNSLLADTWLEYKFGWSPLVSDVEDAFKTLVDTVIYKEPTKYIQFRAGNTDNLRQVVDSVSGSAIVLRRVYQRSDEYQEKLYGVVSLENGLKLSIGGGGYFTLQSIGLDLRSFLPTVYELIPYSFLVDYFSNVNEIINAACFNKTSIKWVNLGTSMSQTLKLHSMELVKTSSSSNYVFDPAPRVPSDVSFEYAFRKVGRSPYSGSLIPSLEFSLPGFGTQAINIAALISSARYTQGLVKKSLRL
jgi:hypothetical protein